MDQLDPIPSKPATTDLAAGLRSAVHEHQRGNYAEAQQQYQQILEIQPDHAKAYQLLGLACFQAGDARSGLKHARQAALLQPESADFQSTLGTILRGCGEYEAAIAAFRRSLGINPRQAGVLFNLGNTLFDLGKQSATAKIEEAISNYQRACRLQPDMADAWHNLGNAFQYQERWNDAFQAYQRALQLRPDWPLVLESMAHNALQRKAYHESIDCFLKLINMGHERSSVHYQCGQAMMETGDWDRACEHFQKAIELNSNNLEYRLGYANALFDCGQLTDAELAYQQILQRDPNHARCRYSRSLLLLHQGKLHQGWRDYEFRLRIPGVRGLRVDDKQLWNGELLPNSILLIDCEQGLGDTIQFVRYARWARERVAKVILRCQDCLVPLLRNIAGVDCCLAESADVPVFDHYVSLLSLPKLHGTTLDSIPAADGYLSASDQNSYAWQQQLRSIDQLMVGLSWQGNPEFKRDHYRSIPLASLAPLIAAEGVRFIKLQKGFGAEQIEAFSQRSLLIDHDGDILASGRDVMETARLIQELDLVITTDSFIAHLAGALGVPTWVVLGAVPEWRWMNECRNSPWYKNVQLFRQPTRGDWGTVMSELKTALQQRIASHRASDSALSGPRFHHQTNRSVTNMTIRENNPS